MRKIIVGSSSRIKKAIDMIKKRVEISIKYDKNVFFIEGSEVNEFNVARIIQAIDFGFDFEDALLLLKPEFNLEYINIKEHTHRANLAEIRSRLIGTGGKAKQTIETLTGGAVVIHGNQVGIIVDVEHVEYAVQGIISLIQGSKHSNVFAYIERQNANLRKLDTDDLGLKNPEKDLKNLD